MGEFDPRAAALSHAGLARIPEELNGARDVSDLASAVACGLVYVGDQIRDCVSILQMGSARRLMDALPVEQHNAVTLGLGVTWNRPDAPPVALDPRRVTLHYPPGPGREVPPRSELISRLVEQLDPHGTNGRLRALIEGVMIHAGGEDEEVPGGKPGDK